MKKVSVVLALFMALLAVCGCAEGTDSAECEHVYTGEYCEERVCEKCGDVLPPTVMHSFGPWQVTEPTCAKEGNKQRVCTRCSFTENVTLPVSTEHSFQNGVCTVCGIEETEVPGYIFQLEENFLLLEDAKGRITTDPAEQGEVLSLLAADDRAGVWFRDPSFDALKTGTKQNVTFRLKAEGNSSYGYSDVRLINEEGSVWDYGFKENEWVNVSIDCTVEQTPMGNAVRFAFDHAENIPLLLAGFSSVDPVAEWGNLFGGVTLYQVRPSGLMEGFVLVTLSGKTVVIDGGMEGEAAELSRIIAENGGKVDHWFLSHYHEDHTDALIEILTNGQYKDVVIENLYYSFPSESVRAQYPNEDFSTVTALEEALANAGGRVKHTFTPEKNDVFAIDASLTIKVLNDAYFGNALNLGNDSSVVYKAETSGEDILFLGDLAEHGDELIRDQYFYDECRSCGVVQMAHHGQAGVSDSFYRELDQIKICLYPGPRWVFDADSGGGINSEPTLKTMHTRDLMRELGVRYTFGGDSGFVLR